jgi:hypothetical protein
VSTEHQSSARFLRAQVGSALAVLALIAAALAIAPATALGQASPTLTPSPSASTTAVAAPALTLSKESGLAGATITVNASGFKAGDAVDVTFNGQKVGEPKVSDAGTFSLSFKVPQVQPGQYAVVAKGPGSSPTTATAAFTVKQGEASLSFSVPQAAPGASLTAMGEGFQPGETVHVVFNGAMVGTTTADTQGMASVTFVVPTIAAGQYDVMAVGESSGVSSGASFTVLAAAATPVPTAAPTAAPTAVPAIAPAPQPIAPPLAHDDRYFAQTGFRIDNDEVWGFFQQYGGLSTFGYPVSRQMQFLGCPVQMFQRHVIQVCAGQGAALINLLDPEIFPYTRVNGSVFPAPDATMKANTPAVGSPTYAEDINKFVQANVPDSFNGQPVNFQTTFNTLGGLTIWGAPISSPQPDPSNGNFIYQRFQRGIMHYMAGSGTQSILLADYLKAIVMNKEVPPDLLAQSRETRYYNQYCPGEGKWLCRPNDLPATDLTFAFTNG